MVAALTRLTRLAARKPANVWSAPALGGTLALLALVLRLLRLDFQPLWWDEGYSVWFATHSLAEMVELTARDIHPPLYYALLHGWIGLLGAGPISLRLLSVLFGVLAIPAIYGAGRRMLGPRAGLLAALLLAINPLHIYYSQEVRMYGLVALLSIGVLAAARELMERIGESANRRPQIGQSARGLAALSSRHPAVPSLVAYIVFTAAALYTQYYAAFLPIGLTLYAGWRWRRRWAPLGRWLAVQAAVALLYLPWMLYAAPRLTLYVSQKVIADADRPLGLGEYAARHLAAFLAGHLPGPLTPYWPLALLPLLPAGLGWGLFLWWRKRTTRTTGLFHHRPDTLAPQHIFLAVTLTALAFGWLVGLRYPFFPEHGERLLLLALPPFVLLLAAGLEALWTHHEPPRISGLETSADRVMNVEKPAEASDPRAFRRRAARFTAWTSLVLIVTASVISLAAFYTVPRYPGDDYRPLIARTVEQGLPEDTVVAVYPWQVGYWRSYGSKAGPIAVLAPAADWTPVVAEALDDALARGKVWFPAHLALGAILETQVEAHLAGRGVPFINEWFGPGTRLSGWAATAAPTPIAAPVIRFPLRGAAGAIELVGVEIVRQPVPAANAVAPITLRWQAPADAPVLRISVRLVDSIGRIWAQHDYERIGESASRQAGETNTQYALRDTNTDRLGLLIPAGTPAGRYFVDVTLHPKGDDRPLDALAADGRSLGAAGRLTELTIAPADRALSPERLPIGIRQPQDFEDGVRLLGHTVDGRAIAPGETRPVNLFWQAAAQPQADYVAFVQLLDGAGQLASLWEAPPGGAWATSAWQPGALIRTQAGIRPRADLPDGRYRLIAGLFRASDKARLKTVAGAGHVLLGEVTVVGRPHVHTPPQPQHPTDVVFGQVGRLIGYDLATPPEGFRAGAAIPLTLYWQADAATERPHTVFVHLVDAAGAIYGYGDGEPGGGKLPTTSWLAHEYLTDPRQVNIAAAAPAGAYRLRIGLYDPTTGQRLLTPAGEDHVEIGPIKVQGR